MRTDSTEYYAARERAERMAAKNATCPEARRVHEEMARAYAQLAESAREQQSASERPAA